VVLLAWGGLACANRAVDGEFYISRSGHAFLMGRMVDTGMLKTYLEEHCATEHYGICAYMDSLPKTSSAFLWRDDSPMAEQGGWASTKKEYDRIILGSFIEPRYLLWHAGASLTSTGEQLCAWEINGALTSQWYRTSDSPPYVKIAQNMPYELDAYLGSMQNGGRGELDMHWPDNIYRFVLLASAIAAVWLLMRRRKDGRSMEARLFLAFSLAAIAIGAWACATLSVVDTRYLGRDSWRLPLAVIIAAMAGYQEWRVARE
jgi:hypothetical protein